MAFTGVIEGKGSREEILTNDNAQLTFKQTATWVEWDDNLVDIPYIGAYWNDSRTDLVCRNISATSTDDPLVCNITSIFSSNGYEWQQGVADQIGSWSERFIINSDRQQHDVYPDFTAGEWKIWADEWQALGADEDSRPFLYRFVGGAEFEVTCYGSRLYYNRLFMAINSVNSTQFISEYAAKREMAIDKFASDGSSWNDTGFWLFCGANMEQVGDGVYRYDLRFKFTASYDLAGVPAGWNTQYGIEVNMYQTMDFITLLSGMDNFDAANGKAGHT